jgi:hypothetical protein
MLPHQQLIAGQQHVEGPPVHLRSVTWAQCMRGSSGNEARTRE